MPSEAPDGGWGYVVVVAAFFVAFLLDGMENSFGVLLPHLVQEFDVDVAIVTFCGGLITAVTLAMGPVAAILIRKFGCRPVAMAGGLIASPALAISTRANSIAGFAICYGVFTGLGMGLNYLPSHTMVNTYFDKKRRVAVGVVSSGSGIGLFVIAILIERLITYYGWRGCYLIMAAIYLNLCVCGALQRPLDSKLNKKLKVQSSESSTCPFCVGACQCTNDDEDCDSPCPQTLEQAPQSTITKGNHDNPQYSPISKSKERNVRKIDDLENLCLVSQKYPDKSHHHSLHFIPMHSKKDCENDAAMRERSNTGTNSEFNSISHYSKHRAHLSHPHISSPHVNNKHFTRNGATKRLLNFLNANDNGGLHSSHRSNINNSLAVLNVPVECAASLSKLSLDQNDHIFHHSLHHENKGSSTADVAESVPPLQHEAEESDGEQSDAKPLKNPLSLLKILRFDLFCCGALLTQVAICVPGMLIPSYAQSLGIDASSAATIVSILGISNTIGRFTAGLLTFLGLRSMRVYNTGIFLAGIVCYLLPWFTTYPALVAFAVCFGLFIGVYPPLQTVILVEQLGLHVLPTSFGLVCLCKSFASVFGPTVAGALFGVFDNYAAPFYFTGGLLTVATILHFIMVYCPKSKHSYV